MHKRKTKTCLNAMVNPLQAIYGIMLLAQNLLIENLIK